MDEYIKRSNLLNKAKRLQGDTFAAPVIVAMIEDEPKADVVEVKHGKWINVQDFGGGKCFADCSICRTQEKAPNPTAFKMFRRYCSYCGAKMDLKEGADG